MTPASKLATLDAAGPVVRGQVVPARSSGKEHAAPRKIPVGMAGDRFEREADRAADAVAHEAAAQPGREQEPGGPVRLSPWYDGGGARAAPPSVETALAGDGTALDGGTRAFMEDRFGHDFSRVRVHTDAAAARGAHDLGARAFSYRDRIAFGAGQFAPETRQGRHLIAHELAHLVQQDRANAFVLRRQAGPDAPAGGGQSMWSRAFALADQTRWEEAAEIVERFSPEHLQYFIKTIGDVDKIAQLHLGAINHKGVGPGSQVARATRVTYLDFNFLEEKRKGNWPRAAYFINAFNADDMRARLKTLDTDKLKALHEGAVANNELGVDSGAAKISAAVLASRSAQGDTKALILPVIKGDSKAALVEVMQVFDSIQPSTIASNLFTMTVHGQPQTLSAAQTADFRKKASAIVKDQLQHVRSMAGGAAQAYKSQSEVDRQHWIVAPIVKTLGRVKDPGPVLLAYAAVANASVDAAYAAVAAGNLTQAASLLASAETSAISASKMWQAYFEGVIGAAEMTVTVLEITQKAAFLSLAILATIATAGAAGGVMAAAEGATVAGVELGVSTVTAANYIAIGAPIVSNLSVAAAKVLMGDKVDWGQLVIDTAIQIILAKFGGRVTGGIAKTLLGNPVTKNLADLVTEKLVHAAVLHGGSIAVTTAAQHAYDAWKGKPITWQRFIDEVIARLTDPESLAVLAVTTAIGSAAEAKYGAGTAKVPATEKAAPTPAGPVAEAPPAKPGTGAVAGAKLQAPPEPALSKVEAPKVETPKAETPKASAPPAGPTKAPAKAAPAKASREEATPPKAAPAEDNVPKQGTSEPGLPQAKEAAEPVTPKADTPKPETPKAGPLAAEAVKVEPEKVTPAKKAPAPERVPAKVEEPRPSSKANKDAKPAEITQPGGEPEKGGPAKKPGGPGGAKKADGKKAQPGPAETGAPAAVSPAPPEKLAQARQHFEAADKSIKRFERLRSDLKTARAALEAARGAAPIGKDGAAAKAADVRAAGANAAATEEQIKMEFGVEGKTAIEQKRTQLLRDFETTKRRFDVTALRGNPEEYRAAIPCFAAGTPVCTPQGDRPIEALAAGDTVVAFDFQSGRCFPARVLGTRIARTERFYRVVVKGEVIRATGAHPFWVSDLEGWVEVRALRPGMRVKTVDGADPALEDVALEAAGEDGEVNQTYNLQLETSPTFFVGPGVLVHNEGIDAKLGGSYLIYRLTNPEFPELSYIGQTTVTGKSGVARGATVRVGEHVAEAQAEMRIIQAELATKPPAARRAQLELALKFFEFKQGAEIEVLVRNIGNKAQADWLEQHNIKEDRQKFGADNVKNRRDQISEGRLKEIEALIRSDPKVNCPL